MFVADESAMFRLLNIYYAVPHPPQDLAEASLFQGFTPGLLESAWMLRQIAQFPRSIIDLVGGSAEKASHRIADGAYRVFPMEYAVLPLHLRHPVPFSCVCSSTAETADYVDGVLGDFEHPVLHITPAGSDIGLPVDKVDHETFRQHALSVAEHLKEDANAAPFAAFVRDGLQEPAVRPPEGSFVSRRHNTTLPNEAVLVSLGYEISGEELLGAGMNNEHYFQGMEAAATEVWALRQKAFTDNPLLRVSSTTDLTLAAPGAFRHMKGVEKRLKSDIDQDAIRKLKPLLRQIIRRDTYNFTAEIGEGETPEDLVSSHVVRSVVAVHSREMRAFTDALCVRASSSVSPVVRLPPLVNGVDHELKMLSSTARGAGPQRGRKLSRLGWQLGETLSDGVPPWLWDLIEKSTTIKIVSDTLLEWLPVDGVPMLLRKETSRIPATPGNLMLGETAAPAQYILPASALEDVLVVSSFRNGDPIRSVLHRVLRHYSGSFVGQRPRLHFRDVKTEDELVATINEFEGAIVVFNSHGSRGSIHKPGQIVLAEGNTDGWSIRGKIRMPPIVLLSACDTHSLDGSHATTANGFLAAGAVSVMGSILPIHAVNAAITVGRLLLRLSHFAPMLLDRPFHSFRWSELLPIVQRRQYVSEVLQVFTGAGGQVSLCPDEAGEIHYELSFAMEDPDIDWHSLLLRRMSDHSKVDLQQVGHEVRRDAYITESLFYLQLGNPEHVVVVRNEDYERYVAPVESGWSSPEVSEK
jgi:hypothetical protein